MEQIPAKHIVTKTKSSDWFGLDYNMNIYRGCCHGCIYCDSRSSCYQITDFDQVRAKENALSIIRDDLRRKVKKGVVGTGAMSDPYNPFEKEQMLTRHGLELIDAFGFGVGIATKSTLLWRDADILESIREHSPVLCKVTITTPKDDLSQIIEPGAPCSSKRMDLIARLTSRNIFAGILLMPVLPFIEDTKEDIIRLVSMAHDAGARFIYPAFGMTLRGNQKEWYFDCLNRLFPEENLPARYIKKYGNSYECASPHAKLLWNAFSSACEEKNILYRMRDIISAYKRGCEYTQLSLFD
ncbi:MAG: radical SAM protein [Lachnospiraceae bacterium]|nr:radical SAM protein [Lachnospiraceae bacterium]